MILPLKLYREHSILKAIKLILLSASARIINVLRIKSSADKRESFSEHFPVLKKNQDGAPECVSCGLCVQICPTKAIRLEVDSKIKMPTSLTTGPAPALFEVDQSLCVQCSLCEQVCPVNALTIV